MATSTQHSTIGRNTTTSTDAVVSNACKYTDDREQRWPAIITKTYSSASVVDLLVLSNPVPGAPAIARFGVQHSIDHKNTNTWDWS